MQLKYSIKNTFWLQIALQSLPYKTSMNWGNRPSLSKIKMQFYLFLTGFPQYSQFMGNSASKSSKQILQNLPGDQKDFLLGQVQNENFPSWRHYKQQKLRSSSGFSDIVTSKHELQANKNLGSEPLSKCLCNIYSRSHTFRPVLMSEFIKVRAHQQSEQVHRNHFFKNKSKQGRRKYSSRLYLNWKKYDGGKPSAELNI